MNLLLKCLAYIYVVLVIIAVVGGPFQIGKDRGVYKPSNYLATLLECGVFILFAGRILGWW